MRREPGSMLLRVAPRVASRTSLRPGGYETFLDGYGNFLRFPFDLGKIPVSCPGRVGHSFHYANDQRENDDHRKACIRYALLVLFEL